MASFDRCPVCGGPIVEREVEKGLRGGVVRETVRMRTDVCLKCGERLYTPEAAQRLENTGSGLKARDTADAQITPLGTKLDYEGWFLGFLEKRYDMVRKNDRFPVVRVTSGADSWNLPARLEKKVEEKVFCDLLPMHAVMPLTFVASCKALDMIFELIFEENVELGKIRKITWHSEAKVELFEIEDNLQLPTFFESRAHLFASARSLFCELMPYRDEVVHRNSFCVSGDTLTLSNVRTGATLALTSNQIDCLVRFVRVLVRALAGEIVVDDHKDRTIQYYLGILAPVIGSDSLMQRTPQFVHVELTAPRKGPAFPADLKLVRDVLSHKFEDQEVFFDLNVIAVDGDKIVVRWHFAPDEVPDVDILTFYEESHKTHREEIVS